MSPPPPRGRRPTARKPDHAVLVVLRLVGTQSTHVTTLHAGTAEAAVTVRIGKSLLYLHQPDTAEHFHRTWRDAHRTARALPSHPNHTLVATVPGMTEPGVLTHATGQPPASTALITPPGRGNLPYLRIQIGRLSYEVRDLSAYGSGLAAFHQAAQLARTAFPTHPTLTPRTRTAVAAAATTITPSPETTELDKLAQLATFLCDRLNHHTRVTQARDTQRAQPRSPGGRAP